MNTETKRIKVANKHYLQADGTKSRSPRADSTAIQYTFGTGDVIEVDKAFFSDSVLSCATWAGLASRLTDSYASSAGDANAAFESFKDTLDVLKSGTWLEEGEKAGPRIGDLAEAIHSLRMDKYPTIESAASMLAALTPVERRTRAAIVAVNARVLEIRAARAKARVEALQGATGIEDL